MDGCVGVLSYLFLRHACLVARTVTELGDCTIVSRRLAISLLCTVMCMAGSPLRYFAEFSVLCLTRAIAARDVFCIESDQNQLMSLRRHSSKNSGRQVKYNSQP